MAYVDWSIKGPEFNNCNCDFGCPCQFSSLPTHGNCHAVVAGRIDEGHFGDVSLDGLCWAMVVSWPKAIHEGNGTMQAIIDERADAVQRKGLTQLLHGRETVPGGTHFQIFSTTMTTVHDPLFKPIEFGADEASRTAKILVPGVFEARGEPIRNPVTGAPHRARIELPEGFEYTVAEIGSGTSQASGLIPLKIYNAHAHWVSLHLTQNGVVR